MNPKKAKQDKVKNAGISLEPKLIEEAKRYAKETGLRTISNLTGLLLVRELQTREIARWIAAGHEQPERIIGFSPPKKNKKAKKQKPGDNPGLTISSILPRKADGALSSSSWPPYR